jgi:asparagine synthase (glutamine-hydrolysing)
MCGIAGIFHQAGPAGINEALLRRMTTAIAYRGPDGDGFHVEPGVGLGHRRLSIIDVSGGAQPMFNEDDSVVISFNGEIFGFAALREQLQAMGHRFRTRSDTETIIHAWESWGPDCLQHLNGFFALALWDRNRRQLFLARDRLGKKPLYYAHTPDGNLVFGSEMRALTCVPGLPRRISPAAVDDYFALGYIPDPATIYEGVHKLPAAHYLLLQQGEAGCQPRRYWDVPTTTQPVGDDAAVAQLTERLTGCISTRMVSDVPLGAFLSGGVDSSAVVAIAAGLRDTPLSTFTIGFPGAEDERGFAQMVATRYGTEHRAEPTTIDYIDAARDQARVFGEPFGDVSSVPTGHVCALARRHVTVALSGDGGDEVLGGYRRYQWHRMTEAVRRLLPGPVRRRVVGELARIYPKLDRAPRWLRAKHTLTEISLDAALGYYRMVCKVQHDRRRALFSGALEAGLDGHDPSRRITSLMEGCGSDDPLLQAQYVDINTYLVGDILTKVDRASMAHSLEVRAPMLDYTFVEWGLGLPPGLKLRGREGKWVLKRAMEPLLPHEVLYRPKQGFAMSLDQQFRTQAGRLRERLLGEAMLGSGLFAQDAIAQLIDEHEAGRFNHAGVLWLLLVFEGFLAEEAMLDQAQPALSAAA